MNTALKLARTYTPPEKVNSIMEQLKLTTKQIAGICKSLKNAQQYIAKREKQGRWVWNDMHKRVHDNQFRLLAHITVLKADLVAEEQANCVSMDKEMKLKDTITALEAAEKKADHNWNLKEYWSKCCVERDAIISSESTIRKAAEATIAALEADIKYLINRGKKE